MLFHFAEFSIELLRKRVVSSLIPFQAVMIERGKKVYLKVSAITRAVILKMNLL
jgi:hypothetical protein